jgi:hypothetical protein
VNGRRVFYREKCVVFFQTAPGMWDVLKMEDRMGKESFSTLPERNMGGMDKWNAFGKSSTGRRVSREQ